MKRLILLSLMMGVLPFAIAARGGDVTKDEQNADSNGGVSEYSEADNAAEAATDTVEDGEPSCETLTLCIEVGGSYTCPADVAEGRSCTTLVGCEDSVVCASDEEACMIECDRVDCAILDNDPQSVQCPDR